MLALLYVVATVIVAYSIYADTSVAHIVFIRNTSTGASDHILVELEGNVDTIDDIDIKYHWNIISNLLQKFDLAQWVNKKPPLTALDRKQQSLLEFV